MSVETVRLSGTALHGVHADGPAYAAAVSALPQTVKLGRRAPDAAAKKRLLHLGDFLDPARRAQTLPASTNWRDKAALAVARMYLNDRYGDCVWASNIHLLGVTSANDTDSGGIVQATDQEVYSQYQRVCGPGDNGCVISRTLDWGVQNGWVAGGKTYKIAGYAAFNWANKDMIKAACQDFGGFKIGVNLPQAWTQNAVWDVTNTGIVGGHDVYVIDYDDSGLYLSSWGRIYRMTWAAALSTRWLEEAYVVVAPTWAGPDQTTPSGYDVAGLVKAMEALANGIVPEDPTPVVPPVPPSPPAPPPVVTPPSYAGTVHFHLPVVGDVVGTVNLAPVKPAMAAGRDVQWFAAFRDTLALMRAVAGKDWQAAAVAVMAILGDLGVHLPFAAGTDAVLGAAPTVAAWQVLVDVTHLLEAITAKDIAGAVAAARKLLADLGVNLPF